MLRMILFFTYLLFSLLYDEQPKTDLIIVDWCVCPSNISYLILCHSLSVIVKYFNSENVYLMFAFGRKIYLEKFVCVHRMWAHKWTWQSTCSARIRVYWYGICLSAGVKQTFVILVGNVALCFVCVAVCVFWYMIQPLRHYLSVCLLADVYMFPVFFDTHKTILHIK